MKKVLLFIILTSIAASAQLQRYDSFAATTTSASGIGNIAQIIPNATLTVFNQPAAGVNCSAGGCVAATTFTSRTGVTACGGGLPLTRPTSNTCLSTADSQGNFGFWAVAGAYQYCIAATSFTTQCTNVALGAPIDGLTSGVYYPNLCGTSNPPSWCSGSDIGAWVNAAAAQCVAPASCRIHIPSGSYTQTTTINITNAAEVLEGDSQGQFTSSIGTLLSYTGSGDSIFIQNSGVIGSGIVIKDLQIIGTSSGASGIHLGNIQNTKIWRTMVSGFTNGTGYWLDNQNTTGNNFNERNSFVEDWSYHNLKGWRFTQQASGGSSFGRTNLMSCHININAAQTGISVESGNYYNAIIEVDGNVDQAGGTVFAVAAGVIVHDNLYYLRLESAGASTLISLGAGSQLLGRGYITGGTTNLTNNINATGTFFILGANDPNPSDQQSAGLGPWLIPGASPGGSSNFGMGFNLRWDTSNWLANGNVGAHNGGGGIFMPGNGANSIGVFIVPDTGSANNQSVSNTTLNADQVAIFGTFSPGIASKNCTTTQNLQAVGSFRCTVALITQKAETQAADASVLAFTPPAQQGTYQACFVASVSSANAGVISWTLSWTDSNGNAQANIAQPLFQLGTAAPNTTFTTSAAGNYQGCTTVDINSGAAAMTVKWVGGGTATAAKVSATIERLI